MDVVLILLVYIVDSGSLLKFYYWICSWIYMEVSRSIFCFTDGKFMSISISYGGGTRASSAMNIVCASDYIFPVLFGGDIAIGVCILI